MRILHTIDSLGIYGAESVLLNLAQEQLRQGHQPLILSIGNLQAGPKALETEARRRAIPCVEYRMKDGLNLRGAHELLRIAAEQRTDVIHSHGYKTNILLGVLPKRAQRIPVITTLHGWTAKSAFSKLGVYRLLDQWLLRRHDGVVLVNEKLRSTAAVASLAPGKLHYVANGIQLDAAADAEAGSVKQRIRALKDSTRVLIGAVGRLSPEKNFTALVDALRRVPDGGHIGLAILGDGPEAQRLQELIAAHGLDSRVILAGYVRDARALLPLFDLLVIPSLTEGLPMILLEGMAASLPMICTRVGDIPAALGDLGMLVEPGDVAALSDAIARMTSNLPHCRARAAEGAARVREHYSAAAMASRYEGIYRSVLSDTRAPPP